MSASCRTQFRPCIDLHQGQVKQIVGGTLSEHSPESLKTNFVSNRSAAEFASLYKENNLRGGHVIKLGPGNDTAAKEALATWPGRETFFFWNSGTLTAASAGGLQLGGGIDLGNVQDWLAAGASKVIVTSYLFPGAKFSLERLQAISSAAGKDRLVIDVSCRRRGDRWFVAMNKWQDITDMEVSRESLHMLSEYCSEFLVHAADVEGLCNGIDEALVSRLGEWVTLPTTYAGGAKDLSDLDLVHTLSNGRVDLTYGSSLDIFGGTLVNFEELVFKSHQL
ncbi:hypothetical protein C8J56DRAFT_1013800 [Mycena floridula]|nr:hypothetical protein C8J56DRAFT_1013800 [Mycena floridula]